MPSHWKDGRIPQGQEQHPVVLSPGLMLKRSADGLVSGCLLKLNGRRLLGVLTGEFTHGATTSLQRTDANSSTDTTPVNSYPAGKSPYGCLDMAGNVWEWTSSIYKTYRFDAEGMEGKTQMPRSCAVSRGKCERISSVAR